MGKSAYEFIFNKLYYSTESYVIQVLNLKERGKIEWLYLWGDVTINVRTDLALEAREIYKQKNNNNEIEGIEVINEKQDEVNITTVKVKNEEGAQKIGKPVGSYITIDIPDFTA